MKRKLQRDKRNGHYFVWIRRGGIPLYFRFGLNKKLAEKELDQVELDIESGKIVFTEQKTTAITRHDGKKDLRIEELAHFHLEYVHKNLSHSTYGLRRHYVLKFLKFIGEVMVSEITKNRLEQFYSSEKQVGSHPNAGYEAMRHVRTLLRWGEEAELVELKFKRFPKMSYVQPETRRVDVDQLVVLLARAPQDFRDFIMLTLLTGLRPYEGRSLLQEHVRHDGHGVSYLFIEKNVKGAKLARMPKPRSVPLCKEAEAIIERQVKAHPQSPLIFLNEDGTPYTRFTLRDRFRRLAKDCGLKGKIIPYGLRHTFASLQAVGGTETTSLAQLMGHSSVRTLQRYVSNTAREHKEAMDRNEQRLMTMLGKADGSESKPSQKLPPKLPPKKTGKRKISEELAQHIVIQPFRLVGDIGLEPTTPTMSR